MVRRRIIPYNPALKPFSAQLRKNSTLAEVLLWRRFRNKQIQCYEFHRHKPLLNYIVDFYCAELDLVIEIDGLYHAHPEQSYLDAEREKHLPDQQLQILHFTEKQVRYNISGVISCIDRVFSNIQETEE